HEPSMLIGPQGVFAAATFAALAAVVAPALEGLRAREYGRGELSGGHVKSLGARANLGTGVAIRYKRDGQGLERAAVTYVLHKAETGWKIAILILHHADQSPSDGKSSR